jgi:hypothetical protein
LTQHPESDIERSETAAVQLLAQLNEVYQSFTGKSQKQERSLKGFARLFRKWFSYNPMTIEPLNQEFLDNVERITEQLAQSFKKLKEHDTAACYNCAAEAANLILAPKPSGEKTTAEWYLTVAEYKSAVILPYLKPDDLKRLRDEQLKATPKRLMYPKQREMLELMEKLLAHEQSS